MSAVEEYKRATFGLRDAEPSTLAGIDHVREKADSAIAELEAQNERPRRLLKSAETIDNQQFDRAEKAEAALAERERMLAHERVVATAYNEEQAMLLRQANRMLRLAWEDNAPQRAVGTGCWYEPWLADLRTRAEEGSEA